MSGGDPRSTPGCARRSPTDSPEDAGSTPATSKSAFARESIVGGAPAPQREPRSKMAGCSCGHRRRHRRSRQGARSVGRRRIARWTTSDRRRPGCGAPTRSGARTRRPDRRDVVDCRRRGRRAHSRRREPILEDFRRPGRARSSVRGGRFVYLTWRAASDANGGFKMFRAGETGRVDRSRATFDSVDAGAGPWWAPGTRATSPATGVARG